MARNALCERFCLRDPPSAHSVTAGTIFHHTHLPFQKWFLAMHLLTQGKHGLSAFELKRQIGVSYETALKVKHELMQVMLP